MTVAMYTDRFFSPLQLMSCFQPDTVPSQCASGGVVGWMHPDSIPAKKCVPDGLCPMLQSIEKLRDKGILGWWSVRRLRTVAICKRWSCKKVGLFSLRCLTLLLYLHTSHSLCASAAFRGSKKDPEEYQSPVLPIEHNMLHMGSGEDNK